MANYRQIHVSIWKDEWFIDLDPDQKLLFIYLFSNESASLSGLYKLPLKVIAFETGLDAEYIIKTMKVFSDAGKVHYQDGVVWVVNMRRYHETKSDKVQTRINHDIENIPECEIKRRYKAAIIPYQYPIDTTPQLKEDVKEKEVKEEKEKEKEVNDGFTLGVLAELSSVFVSETQIPEMTGGPPRWIGALQKMVDAGITPEDLRAGIRALKKKDYKIAGPWSVHNAAVMEMSSRKAGKSDGGLTFAGEWVS